MPQARDRGRRKIDPDDAKSSLQELLAQRGEIVAYQVISEEGPPHQRTFEVTALVNGSEIGRGSGRSKEGGGAGGGANGDRGTGPEMHLKSITLKGFKSFPDRTRLEFGPGVSVVVGPNGSGKSNVTDAVLWALGEQSPLAVRGQSMQDVIFGGARGQQARRAAEVELVIDSSDTDDPVLRGLDTAPARSHGGGEYRLNGARCRLVDVIEVLSDTGLGKEMHSVISQGRVEGVVTSKPRDRRLLIEEAAGLGKHRKRRRRAQLKLARTQDNLDRALDVEREARSRLRPLKRQAEAAGAPGAHRAPERGGALELVARHPARAQRRTGSGRDPGAPPRAHRPGGCGGLDLPRSPSVASRPRTPSARAGRSLRTQWAHGAGGRLRPGAGSGCGSRGVRCDRGAADRARRRRAFRTTGARPSCARRSPRSSASATSVLARAADGARVPPRRGRRAGRAASPRPRRRADERPVRRPEAACEAARSARREADAAAQLAASSRPVPPRSWAGSRSSLAAHAGAPGGGRALADELDSDPGYERALAAALGGRLGGAAVADRGRAAGASLLDTAGDDAAAARSSLAQPMARAGDARRRGARAAGGACGAIRRGARGWSAPLLGRRLGSRGVRRRPRRLRRDRGLALRPSVVRGHARAAPGSRRGRGAPPGAAQPPR